MPAVAPQPSARLVRAVTAERAELERHRARLTAEAAELRAALTRIENGLAEIDERCGLLDRLTPIAPATETAHPPSETALRGPAIRAAAVDTLVKAGRDAMHYRQWFELLQQRGHAVAGKDPLAVFLTQISRSPAVRRGTRAGVYELDRAAPRRLRAQLDALQRDLTHLPAAATEDLGATRSRRSRLLAEIGRTERALEEVSRVLTPPALTGATA